MKDRLRRKLEHRDIVLIISIVLWVAVIGVGVGMFFKVNTDARRTLREGKDVLTAMKMLAIEKYRNGTVYDLDSNSGISKSVENQIRKLSDTKGYVTIISWDNINNEPISFTYRNGNYIAYYVRGKKGYAEWTVRLSLKVMNYSNE